MGKLNNLYGRRFGRLLVKSKSDRTDKAGNLYWNCECDCGNKKEISGLSLIYDRTVSCGCFGNEQRRKANLKSDVSVATNLLFLKYQNQANRRGIEFSLTQEQFRNIIYRNCEYCGALPSNSFNNYRKKNQAGHLVVLYNGIDRIDSSKGYTLENCVPCCQVCNYGKRSLTEEQFLNWIRSVYLHKIAGIQEKTPSMLIDELGTTLIKCFMAQEDIMNPNLSPEKQSDAAHRAQELNARRNKLIRALDEQLGYADFSHTAKTYYTYLDKDTYFKEGEQK